MEVYGGAEWLEHLSLTIFTPHLVFAWVLSLLAKICSLSTSAESSFLSWECVLVSLSGTSVIKVFC